MYFQNPFATILHLLCRNELSNPDTADFWQTGKSQRQHYLLSIPFLGVSFPSQNFHKDSAAVLPAIAGTGKTERNWINKNQKQTQKLNKPTNQPNRKTQPKPNKISRKKTSTWHSVCLFSYSLVSGIAWSITAHLQQKWNWKSTCIKILITFSALKH